MFILNLSHITLNSFQLKFDPVLSFYAKSIQLPLLRVLLRTPCRAFSPSLRHASGRCCDISCAILCTDSTGKFFGNNTIYWGKKKLTLNFRFY
jgi:hypothetical protein